MFFNIWENFNLNFIAFARAMLEYKMLHDTASSCHLQILLQKNRKLKKNMLQLLLETDISWIKHKNN